MPSRIFTQLDIINFTHGYILGPNFGFVPSVSSPNFGNLSVSGSLEVNPGMSTGSYGSVYCQFNYVQSATINYQSSPAIPNTPGVAKITKIRVTLPATYSIQAFARGQLADGSDPEYIAAIYGYSAFVSGCVIPTTGQGGSPGQVGPYTLNISGGTLNPNGEEIIEFDPPIDYATLEAGYANPAVSASIDIRATGLHRSLSFNLQAGEPWQWEVTWYEQFSWYVTPIPAVTPGGAPYTEYPIVPIEEGEEIPEGAILIGTPEEYPSIGEIPVIWYIYPPTEEYIESPLPPGPGWIPSGPPPVIPELDFESDLIASFSLESTYVFMVNPSGIYTLIKGKTHDTLYNRIDTDSVDVKIPDPYIKTSYVP